MGVLLGTAAVEECGVPPPDTSICAPESFLENVTPSVISVVQYDERVRILAVEFADDSCYHFLDVPEPIYLGLVRSPAIWDYFLKQVAGRFAFRRMA